ncbi:MAG: S8 family serine peptidase [Microbacteriaceae bacterium]
MRRLAGAVATLVAAAVLLPAAVAPAPAAQANDVADLQYWLDEYGIRQAWQTTRGAGVTIAVIDTGIDSSHPDLQGAVTGGADFSGIGGSDGQSPVGSDGSGHGTLVGSLAAGRGVDSEDAGPGVIGSAPAASLLSISIGFGEGDQDSDTQIAEAVRWAVDNGADVINMSLTRNTRDWPVSWDDAFLYAAENDVVVVAAAGNRGSGTVEVGAPATMPGVLTVGGVDRSGRASFDASSQGLTIAVTAPSEELVGAVPGGTRATWSGTSGASPIVAGIVALVRAAHPELDVANVINRITATARDVGDPGADVLYGFGLVDAAAAVSATVPAVEANPMGDLADWVQLYRRADVDTGDAAAPGIAPQAPAGPPEPWTPIGVLLPASADLRLVGIPALAIVVLLGLTAAVITGVARGFNRTSRKR